MEEIKVLAFDIGGTVLDWHAGLTVAMTAWGTAHGVERDWHAVASEHRRRSLRQMTNTVDPRFSIDDVHRDGCHALQTFIITTYALPSGLRVSWTEATVTKAASVSKRFLNSLASRRFGRRPPRHSGVVTANATGSRRRRPGVDGRHRTGCHSSVAYKSWKRRSHR